MEDLSLITCGLTVTDKYVADNGYLNFLHEFRTRNTELDRLEALKQAPDVWLALNRDDRERYRMMPSITTSSSDDEDVDEDDGDSYPGACCPKKQNPCARKSVCVKKPVCPKRPPCLKKPCQRPQKKKRCCPRKPACPKKNPCTRKPACPKKKACGRKAACPKKRKNSCCPKKPACARKPTCPKKRSCSTSRSGCGKENTAKNNGYLNFISAYRKKHCNLEAKELVMRAARAWCRLTEAQKQKYRRQSCSK